MKERVINAIGIVVILLIIYIGCLFYFNDTNANNMDDGFNVIAYESNIIEVKALEEKTEEIKIKRSINEIIIKDGNISDNYFSNVKNNYNKISENVRMKFEDSGWTIIVTDKSLESMFNLKNKTVAVIEYPKNLIYISNKGSSKSLFHEFGHYINYLLDFVDKSDEFNNIHKLEKNKFISYTGASNGNTKTTLEYFAESYQEYINNPESLKKNCPKTFEFIDFYNKKI